MAQGTLLPNHAEVELICLRPKDGAIQMEVQSCRTYVACPGCRFSFTWRKRASMSGFIPLPVENSFTCRIPVRRLRAGSMLQFSG
jgi:hypothetical protein